MFAVFTRGAGQVPKRKQLQGAGGKTGVGVAVLFLRAAMTQWAGECCKHALLSQCLKCDKSRTYGTAESESIDGTLH